jgi:NAD(P)-dependent dehydrogenase (short-subunit alcohol dehydrogenase family)
VNIISRFKTALAVLMKGSPSRMPLPQTCMQAPQYIQEPESSAAPSGKLLTGKNVLITGAGKNIGRSTALEMALHGANVFFTDIDKPALQRLEHELTGFQVKSRGFFSDVSEMRDIDELYAFMDKNRITIDVLVNNAGIQHEDAGGIKKLEPAEWHKTFSTNVFGPAYLTKLISQMMINNGTLGSIVFITSIHDTTIRHIPSYSASKAALGMVVKELAMELAPHGIRVNGIAPGCVREDEKGNTVSYMNVPLHKSSINPVYIGRAAVYLASDYFSRFTTGSTIKIDAGATLLNHLSVLETYFRRSDAR